MENKRIKPELVISDEKEIIRELSEAVLSAVELTARGEVVELDANVNTKMQDCFQRALTMLMLFIKEC